MPNSGGIDLTHPGWWALGWAIVSNLFAAMIGVYVWLTTRHAASIARVDGIEREIFNRMAEARGEHDPIRVTVARLEEAIRHVPNQDDLKDVYDRLNPLTKEVAGLRGELGGMHDALDDIKRGVAMIHESMLRREDRHL
jgi:hypothetical protein